MRSVDFVAKEILYYGICRTKYETAAEPVSKTSQNKEVAKRSTNLWHKGREVHSEDFKSICSLVKDQVITGGDVLGLKDAFKNYQSSIFEDLDAQNLVTSYTAQKLDEKLKLHFQVPIIIHKGRYKRGGSPFKWNHVWWHCRWISSNFRAINSILHPSCCWSWS